jgi:hypothetical protein
MVYRNDGAGAATIVACDGTGLVASSCLATGLVGGTTYGFVVSALSSVGEGARSSPALAVVTPLPPATALASTSTTSTTIALSWAAPSAGAAALTGYRVYRRVSARALVGGGVVGGGGTVGVSDSALAHFFPATEVDVLLLDAAGAATTASLSGLSAGTSYTLLVAAVAGSGEGVRSAPLVQSTAPPAPSNLVAAALNGTAATVSWMAASVSSGAAAVTGYTLLRDDGSGGSATPATLVASLAVTAGTSAYTQTIVGLQPSTTYRLAVSASSAVGDSDLSAVAALTTPSQ